MTLPTGGYISYAYSGGNNGITCVTNGTSPVVPTLTRTINDGNGHNSVWTFQNSSFIFNSPFTVNVTDPAGNLTVISYDTNLSNTEIERQTYQGTGGTPLRTQFTKYTRNGLGAVIQTDVYTYLNGSSNASAVETKFDPTSGAITEVKKYDFGAATSMPPPATPLGTPVSDTVIVYGTWNGTSCVSMTTVNASIGAYMLDYPCTVTTKNASGSTVADTRYTYNAGGHPTQASRLVSGSVYQTSSAIYNNNGTIASLTDPKGAITQYSYNGTGGCNNLLLTSTVLPIVGSSSQTWNCNGAVLTSATDVNSQITSYSYVNPSNNVADPFWRLTQVTYPDGGQVTTAYNSPTSVTTTTKINATQNIVSTRLLDGLGRAKQMQLNSDPQGVDYTDITYDVVGHVFIVSNPYRSTSDPTYGLTTYAYDALGRATQVTNPDNSTVLTTYNGPATQVSDEGNGTQRVTRISQEDGLGRVTSVCEVSSAALLGNGGNPSACNQAIPGTGFLTTYQVNALDNLTSVSMSGLNPRTFAYDSLSRLTNATDPESGMTTFTYDSDASCPAPNSFLGLLVSKRDARGIRTCMQYDALNRLTGKTYSDGTPAATFNYDQSSALGVTLINTKGRKSSESTAGPNATGSVFSYDQMGRVANNSQCTPQNCGTGVFAFQYTQYDSVGDLISATNAAGVTFNYAYNTVAQLTGISTNFIDGSHPGTLFSNAQYSPFGTLTSATLGNGVTESWSYNNRLWQQSRTATFGATTPYSFSVPTFAPNGDILAGNDSVNGNWSYSYDPFNRLLSANTAGQAYTYDYDRYGNRWHQNGPHSSQLGFDANNHITGVTGVSYDLAGNLTSDGSGTGSHNYFYDAENRIIQVGGTLGTCSTATACYVYDAEGRRVRKTTSGSSMDYLYDLAGHKVADVDPTGVFMQGELYAGDRHFAIYAPNPGPTGATFFPHGDWLGTERVRTDMTGTNCESIASLPFGDGQSITGTCGDVSPMHFTGDERDSETSLDHTWFRQYSSSLGRWMPPDPADLAAVAPSNPQSWNRYAYVANQPIDSTDPSGLDRICADPKIRALCTSSQVVGNPLSSLIWDEFALVELALAPASVIGLETVNMYSDTGGLLSSTSSDILSYPSLSAVGLLGQGGGNSSISIWDFFTVPWSGTVLFPLVPFGPFASAGAGPTVAYNPKTDTGCYGLAVGAMVPAGGRAAAAGPLTVGNLGNADNILAGGSVFAGAQSPNPAVGVQTMGNSSGLLAGATFGTMGAATGASYSKCQGGVGKKLLNSFMDSIL